MTPVPPPRPRVGISACLLGAPVRWDGADKGAAFPLPELAGRVEWVPVCPEVESGMPVPREPVRLERADADTGAVRLVGVATRADHTERAAAWARTRLARLAPLGLAGFVLKARSPSCGPAGVPLVAPDGREAGTASGVFAAALRAAFPALPVEDEVGLADPAVRAAFVRRVLAARAPGPDPRAP